MHMNENACGTDECRFIRKALIVGWNIERDILVKRYASLIVREHSCARHVVDGTCTTGCLHRSRKDRNLNVKRIQKVSK